MIKSPEFHSQSISLHNATFQYNSISNHNGETLDNFVVANTQITINQQNVDLAFVVKKPLGNEIQVGEYNNVVTLNHNSQFQELHTLRDSLTDILSTISSIATNNTLLHYSMFVDNQKIDLTFAIPKTINDEVYITTSSPTKVNQSVVIGLPLLSTSETLKIRLMNAIAYIYTLAEVNDDFVVTEKDALAF